MATESVYIFAKTGKKIVQLKEVLQPGCVTVSCFCMYVALAIADGGSSLRATGNICFDVTTKLVLTEP